MFYFIAFYIVFSVAISLLISRFAGLSKLDERPALFRAVILGALFGPSLFISSHTVIPTPAVVALFLGVTYPSPAVSQYGAVGVYMVAWGISTLSIYMHYRIKKNRSLKNS